MTDVRRAEFPIDPQFVGRWSPRAFDGTALAPADLMCLFEAARWAPSAFNVQPWRFLYATRDDEQWQRFLGLLVPFNQSWARNAGALIIVLSDSLTTDPDGGLKQSHSNSFDAGAAWGNLALQAYRMGLHSHAMTGIDLDAVRNTLSVPERYRVECSIAVGRIGNATTLPESLRGREMPSGRRTVAEIAFAGDFPEERHDRP